MKKNRFRKPTPCYCLRILRATAAVTNHYDRVLAPCGVTVRQYSVLFNIDLAKQCSIKNLADMAELDRSTLARNLQPLLHQGLVVDTRQAGRRNCQLELTEAGGKKLEYAKKLWAEAQEEFVQRLGAEGMDSLKKVLEALESF